VINGYFYLGDTYHGHGVLSWRVFAARGNLFYIPDRRCPVGLKKEKQVIYKWVAELFFKVKYISLLLGVEKEILLDISLFLCHG